MKPISRIGTPDPEPPAQGWQLERRIPLTLVFALVMQGAGLVIWGTYLQARVDALAAADVVPRLVRIEERLDAVRDELKLLRERRH